MKARILPLLLALLLSVCALAGCGGEGDQYGDPNANREVPSDSVKLELERESNGKSVQMVGTELDPHFLTGNVGRTMTSQADGSTVTVKESDWNDYILPRMREMKLGYIRTMLLPSWWAKEEVCYTDKAYTWDSPKMQDVYLVLDAAQELGMEVCLTIWLWDCDYARLDASRGESWNDEGWTLCPQGEGDTVFAEVFADCVDYLINTKGYTCIKWITPINEPNSTYGANYSPVQAVEAYASLCREIDRVFREKGIREKVKFSLSDDARSSTWLYQTCELLQGVYDVVNSHTYDFDESYTNAEIVGEGAYCLKNYVEAADEYGVPHVYGEFGTNTYTGPSNWKEPRRGLQIARIAANMFQSGSCGMSYWMLFCYYWNWTGADESIGNVMGLWGAADENYNCYPVYYAYSMLTRFVRAGMEIYPVQTDDPNLVAVGFRSGEDWTYLVVNDSETESKKISFLNNARFPGAMKRYVYDQNNVPTDNKVIASNGTVTPDGRVLTDMLAPLTFTVYTTLPA